MNVDGRHESLDILWEVNGEFSADHSNEDAQRAEALVWHSGGVLDGLDVKVDLEICFQNPWVIEQRHTSSV